jgi:hypothetical protein
MHTRTKKANIAINTKPNSQSSTIQPTDLMRYVYGEMSEAEKENARLTILSDPDLSEDFYQLLATKKEIEACVAAHAQNVPEPSQATMDRIFLYAQQRATLSVK